MKKSLVMLAAIGGLLATLSVSPSPVAHADELLPIEKANPGISQEMVDSLPEVIQQREITIDDEYKIGMPIVYPDGTPVEGQNLDPEILAACGRYNFAALPGGAWGPASVANCGVVGNSNNTKIYYWGRGPGVRTQGCTQGRSYYYFTRIDGVREIRSKWSSTSCGASGSGSVYWHNNILSVPKFRARSNGGALGFSGTWNL